MRQFFILFVLAGFCCAAGGSTAIPPAVQKSPRLAILVAFPIDDWKDAGNNDVTAMYSALRQRGFDPKEILILNGPATRPLLLEFLREGGKKTATWTKGSVVLYYTGGGSHAKLKSDKKGLDRVGWNLYGQPEDSAENPTWREILQALNLSEAIDLTLLPDCCYSNMLVGHLPKNVAGLVLEGDPNDWKCQAANHAFDIQGKKTTHGVITFFAVQALKDARTVGDLQQRTNVLMDNAAKEKVFGQKAKRPPMMATVGDANRAFGGDR
jgi:hypothetical protein